MRLCRLLISRLKSPRCQTADNRLISTGASKRKREKSSSCCCHHAVEKRPTCNAQPLATASSALSVVLTSRLKNLRIWAFTAGMRVAPPTISTALTSCSCTWTCSRAATRGTVTRSVQHTTPQTWPCMKANTAVIFSISGVLEFNGTTLQTVIKERP